jgi:hypothetical protein
VIGSPANVEQLGLRPRGIAIAESEREKSARRALLLVSASRSIYGMALGILRQVAAMTDAVVLVSFFFVNGSLAWLAAWWRTPASGGTRVAEILIPSAASLLCAWLLWHAGVTSIVVALGLGLVMLATTSASSMLAALRRLMGETR